MGKQARHRWAATTAAGVLGLCTSSAAFAAFDIGFIVSGGIESTNLTGEVLPKGQHVQTYWLESLNPPGVDVLNEQRNQTLMSLTGATSSSRASFGDLGVYAQTWVMPKLAGVYGDWISNASARARFLDVWTISAPGHGVGAPVTMMVGFQLDGWLTPDRELFRSSLCVGFHTFLPNGESERGVCPTSPGFYTLAVPARLNVDFGVAMEVTGFSSAYNQWESGTSTVDFYNSAVITSLALADDRGAPIDSFSLAAGSQHVYLPVPEPGTVAMWLAGLLALAGQVRRAHRR